MLDIVIKVLALACFIAYVAVLAIWVPDPDLVVVLVIVAAMAIYDFLIRPYRMRNSDGS
jgi:hypothetical protein